MTLTKTGVIKTFSTFYYTKVLWMDIRSLNFIYFNPKVTITSTWQYTLLFLVRALGCFFVYSKRPHSLSSSNFTIIYWASLVRRTLFLYQTLHGHFCPPDTVLGHGCSAFTPLMFWNRSFPAIKWRWLQQGTLRKNTRARKGNQEGVIRKHHNILPHKWTTMY